MVIYIFIYKFVHSRFIFRLYEINLSFIFSGECIFKIVSKYFTAYFKRLILCVMIDLSHANMERMWVFIRQSKLQKNQEKPFIKDCCHLPQNLYVYKSPDYFHNYISVFFILSQEIPP